MAAMVVVRHCTQSHHTQNPLPPSPHNPNTHKKTSRSRSSFVSPESLFKCCCIGSSTASVAMQVSGALGWRAAAPGRLLLVA